MKVELVHRDAGDNSIEIDGRRVATFVDHEDLAYALELLVENVKAASAVACEERASKHEIAATRACADLVELDTRRSEARKCADAIRRL